MALHQHFGPTSSFNVFIFENTLVPMGSLGDGIPRKYFPISTDHSQSLNQTHT